MLHKIHCYTIAAIFFCILLNSCSEKDPDKYYNSKDNFSIKFPKQWEIKEGFMGTSVIALQPKISSIDQFRDNVNVLIEKLPGSMNMVEYLELNENNMRKILTDYSEIEKGDITIAGETAKWIIYSARMGTINLRNKVYFIVHDKRAYVITCSSTPNGFSQSRNIFENIAQSFEFE